ncbi:MAG TPA: hypothetical protein VN692_14480 [Steroidobacteraceae bacterium]|nr:hypothetical protein [Steroidobacteraceae bacterium]
MPADFSKIGPYLFAALLIFAIYRRFRRNFGRQPLRPARMKLRIALLAFVCASLAPTALRSGVFLSAVAVGAACGAALGVWGAQRTRFLTVAQRLHYVPHTYTGVAVSLLFLGRLVYRLVQVYWSPHASPAAPGFDPAAGMSPASMVQSPLTLGLFFVLAGYYICYYALVLWKSKHIKPQDIEAASADVQIAVGK